MVVVMGPVSALDKWRLGIVDYNSIYNSFFEELMTLARFLQKYKKNCDTTDWLKGVKERLKSLRPQPHWKPSEEQMRYLLAAINEPNNAGSESCYIVLKSLYRDLKKL